MLIPISLLLRLTGEHEVFFLQERIGMHGKPFKLFKFATMLKNSPSTGTGTITIKNDPRVLPIGKFLRSTKINELPQIINILLGDMSVIGPRPLTHQTFNAYSDIVQKNITNVRPGLSGIGSIIFRDEENILTYEKNPLFFYSDFIAPYKGELECWFVDNNSIMNYFKLILVTVCIVLFPKTQIAWFFFNNLPIPPLELRSSLNYPTFSE